LKGGGGFLGTILKQSEIEWKKKKKK
jgi:hypothetical protein